jgi:hypothetical protein
VRPDAMTDTTIARPIWWDGVNWINAVGAIV